LAGEREYIIKHALTREVAYASLPKARRARLHAAFARWLEVRAEGREELAPLVAHHYAESIRPGDRDLVWSSGQEEEEEVSLRNSALMWLQRAADLAVRRYEIADGLDALRRAVALEPDAGRQADLWYEIGHASALRYDGEGFVAAMEKAQEHRASEAKD
jgi:predicted ATPase